jgi:hypothetical protein
MSNTQSRPLTLTLRDGSTRSFKNGAAMAKWFSIKMYQRKQKIVSQLQAR